MNNRKDAYDLILRQIGTLAIPTRISKDASNSLPVKTML